MQINQTVSANKAYKAYCQSLSDPSKAVSFKQWLINQKSNSGSTEQVEQPAETTEKLNFYNADAAANAPDTKIRVLGMPIAVAIPVLVVGVYAGYKLIKFLVNRNKTVVA